MASKTVLRTCGLIINIILHACAEPKDPVVPWIVSFEVTEKNCVENNCKYLLKVHGGEFLGHYSWRLTPEEGSRGGSCETISPNYELREINTDQWETEVEIIVPNDEEKFYFCLRHSDQRNNPFGGEWVHQGKDIYLEPKNDFASLTRGGRISYSENVDKSSETLDTTSNFDLSHDIDVNNLPHVSRPARHKLKDIEVLIKDKYVPLNKLREVTLNDNVQRFNNNDDSINVINNNNFDSTKKIQTEFGIGNLDADGGYSFESWNENANFLSKRKRSVDVEINSVKDANFNEEVNAKKVSRRKRNATDDLITSHLVAKAKSQLENEIKDIATLNHEEHEDALIKARKERQVDFTSVKSVSVPVKIEGIRVEDSEKEPKIVEDGVPSVLADTGVTLRIFGEGITDRTVIAFTYDAQNYGEPCKYLLKGEYTVKPESLMPKSALFDIKAPPPILGSKLYICAKNLKPGVEPSKDEEKYIHQGQESFKIFASHNKLLPLWVSLTLILICLMFSALFSGLNLGLMSLDRTELKIISNTGTEQERKYARAIMPVRDHGNYLLCSILLGNVAVNSTFTILLDDLTSGLFAVIFSTLSIVLLGEITPQAICSRHGLMVGAKSIMITKAVMALTAPLAYPVSKLLDYFLGEEIGSVYNRERLKELVKVTTDVNDLDKDEVNIISGALELRKKTVSDVMTKLEDVFMLPINSVLDFETMSEIVKSGYSRIPVYEGSRSNIVTVLFIKDLAFVDPDDNTPLRTLCQYYQNPCNFVFEDVTLDVMFKQFKDGHKGHMAFVHRINNEGEGDPFYETIGLVTLEDVIEEMIQAEIVDETDVFMDNRTKRRRNRPANKLQDFTAFAERHENQRIHISPQLTLATFQFLSTSVDAFRPDMVSETVLRRLLKQDVIQHIKLKGKTKKDPSTFVYLQGKPVDYFVLILEGRVEVTVGRENLVFEAGPFTYFGSQALTQNVGVAESPTPSAMGSLQNINMDSMLRHTFVPDYSVRAITELFYLTVKRSLYLAAKRATLMEKGALSKGATHEQFDTEVDKHLIIGNSSSANIPISMISKKLLGKSTSTNSTKDDVGSTSTGYKLTPRVNIMEVVRVCGATGAPATWPADTRASAGSLAAIATDHTKWPSLQDGVRSAACCDQERSQSLASRCSECVTNNFWLTRAPFDKSPLHSCEMEHGCRNKKKTTFHTDSSLLTFHPISPPTRDIEYEVKNTKSDSKTNRPKEGWLGTKFSKLSPKNQKNENENPMQSQSTSICKVRNIDKELKSSDISNVSQKVSRNLDVDSGNKDCRSSVLFAKDATYIDDPSSLDEREFERNTIDYSVFWREERIALEKRRIEMDERVLSQLSQILTLLKVNLK